MSRFFRLLALTILLLSVVAQVVVANEAPDVATDRSECGTNGECHNPDADVAAAATEVVVEEEEIAAFGETVAEDPKCPSRELVIRCAGIHLDTNGNGKLEREELQTAIDSLPWYSRGILNILGSVHKMISKCDIDGDDAIGMTYDMEHNKETCLATCFKRRAFKSSFFPDCGETP